MVRHPFIVLVKHQLVLVSFYMRDISMQKCNCTYLQFWAFLVMSVTILARDHIEIWFYFKYAYLKEHISAFEKILSFGHQVILPLKHCICEKKIVLKVGFQNIFFLLYGLLGISANFNKKMPENRIFCDFEAWSLRVPMRSHVLFFFHYTSMPRTQKP